MCIDYSSDSMFDYECAANYWEDRILDKQEMIDSYLDGDLEIVPSWLEKMFAAQKMEERKEYERRERQERIDRKITEICGGEFDAYTVLMYSADHSNWEEEL